MLGVVILPDGLKPIQTDLVSYEQAIERARWDSKDFQEHDAELTAIYRRVSDLKGYDAELVGRIGHRQEEVLEASRGKTARSSFQDNLSTIGKSLDRSLQNDTEYQGWLNERGRVGVELERLESAATKIRLKQEEIIRGLL